MTDTAIKTAHTPGPWEAGVHDNLTNIPTDGPSIIVTAPHHYHGSTSKCRIVALCGAYDDPGRAISEADARLIAAVPELYEEAVKMVEWLGTLADHSVEQSKITRFPGLAEANAKDAVNFRKSTEGLRAAIAKAEATP